VRPDTWITLALAVLAFAYFSLTFTGTLDLRDEGYLLARSQAVAEGAVPHRDFADVYGPGVFTLSGAALSLGGGQILATRILVALFKALAIAVGYAISRRYAPRWLAVFAAGVGIAYWGRFSANLNAPYAALFTIPIALAATLALIRSLERGSLRALVLAGGLAGLGLLFKQSLGLMLGYGMLLSAVAFVWLAQDRQGSQPSTKRFAVAWLLAGAVVVLPVAGYLTPADYGIHFLPLHAIVVGVAALAWQRRAPNASRLLRETLAPFLGGMAIAPGCVVLFYAVAGGLGPLLHDMFILPLSLRGYYQPAPLPPLALAVVVTGGVAVVVAGLLALGRHSGPAAWLALAAVATLLIGRFAIPNEIPRLYEPAVLLGRGPFALEGVLAPVLLFAALAVSARRIADPPAGAARLSVLLVSSLLCFEVFPRAGHNLWILHGALFPLLALVLADLLEATGVRRDLQPFWRRAAAAGLVVTLPIWLVIPIVRTVLLPDESASHGRPIALEQARGLSLDARQIEEQRVRDVEELVAWLAAAQPAGAPLLMLTNEAMIPFLAGRPLLFADYSYALFLAGWGMLPAEQWRELDGPELLARVRRAPELLVIHRSDSSAANLRRVQPRLRDYIEKNFQPVARFGDYRVLRHVPAPSGSG
jgi:hypothetical protein